MHLARVIGTVVAPVQHPFYDGRKLLLVRRCEPDGRPCGPDNVAIDRVDAGVGDFVLLMQEGSSARDIVGEPNAPVRTVIVGFVDEVEMEGRVVARSGDGNG